MCRELPQRGGGLELGVCGPQHRSGPHVKGEKARSTIDEPGGKGPTSAPPGSPVLTAANDFLAAYPGPKSGYSAVQVVNHHEIRPCHEAV
jgi:hypothetical protein